MAIAIYDENGVVCGLQVWPLPPSKAIRPTPTHCEHCGAELWWLKGALFCSRRCEPSRPIAGRCTDESLIVKPQSVAAFAKAIREAEQQGV